MKYMEDKLGALLKSERVKRHLSKRRLGMIAGVSRQYVSAIEDGSRRGRISAEIVVKLANALDMSSEPFLEAIGLNKHEGQRPLATGYSPVDLVTVPIMGTLPCGRLSTEDEQPGGMIRVMKEALDDSKVGNCYALRVSGDSLEGDGIHDGEIVLIDKTQTEIINGRIYVVRKGNEVCGRHVFKMGDHLRLVSSNAEYEDVDVNDVEIQGRVVSTGKEWRKL